MKEAGDRFALVQGSRNVVRDFGYADADVQQAKALLATEIIDVLDTEGLSTRKAQERTGIAYADSRASGMRSWITLRSTA